MLVGRDETKEHEIQLVMRQSFAETRTGVHLSDLLNPRQSFWKRRLPLLPSPATAWYFALGIGHEEALARMLKAMPNIRVTEQKFRFGISYRPDFTYDGAPAEMKTRRANLATPGEESLTYDKYLDQLRGYCALEDGRGDCELCEGDGNATTDTEDKLCPRCNGTGGTPVPCREGYLLVVSMLEGRDNRDPLKPTEPAFRVHPVTFTESDLEQTRQWLIERRDAFLAALESGDGSALPLCAPWMCGKPRKKVITSAHCTECDKDLSEPWASKHATTRAGAGHTVSAEVVEWSYVPRCDWHAYCAPQTIDPTRGAR